MSSMQRVGTLEPMSSPVPTQAVANLHLHLEYDSGLDVIAAAMATVPEGAKDTDEHRAHVSHDISSAVAHLLDIEALTPEGCPIRVTEASMQVSVNLEEPHDHEDDDDDSRDPEEVLDSIMEKAAEFADAMKGLSFSADEMRLVARAGDVGEVTGPPPFQEMEGKMPVPQLLTEWGILCGYLAEACSGVIDTAFDDLDELTRDSVAGREIDGSQTQIGFRLPGAWDDRYNIPFFRRFIVTLSEVTTRMTYDWEPPSNLAQVVALSVIFDEMQTDIDFETDLGDEEIRPVSKELVEILRERMLPTDLLEDMFADEPSIPFDAWFFPITPDERVAPYASDDLGDDDDEDED